MENVVQVLKQIQKEWTLSNDQFADLLHVSRETLEKAFDGAPSDVAFQPTIPTGLDAAMPVISIHRRLSLVYPEAQDRLKWLDTPHSAFGQTRPMAVMLSGQENLSWVAYFLAHAQDR